MKASVLCSALFVAITACAPTKQVRAEDATMNVNMDIAMSEMENENMPPSTDRINNMNDVNNKNGMNGMNKMENMGNMDDAMNMKRGNDMTGTMNNAMNENDMADGMNKDTDMNMDMAMKRDVQGMDDMNKGMEQAENLAMPM